MATRRIIPIFPIAGVAIAAILYFCAAAQFPTALPGGGVGGGYFHLRNYWCDLYSETGPAGDVNRGRPYAMAATLALVASLLFFWVAVAGLFAEFFWMCWIVRVAGGISAAAALFIFTRAHDAIILLAAPMGFCAILVTCAGLGRKREWGLLLLAAAALGVAIWDYVIWTMGAMRPYQPMLQKLAFVLIFSWVVMGALRALMASGGTEPLPAGGD